MPPSLADLPPELIEEVLVRLPPAEPASLVRAVSVCKSWWRLISGRRFRRRFCEFHRAAPTIGDLVSFESLSGVTVHFLPDPSHFPPHAEKREGRALDSRHGLVLLHIRDSLIVWDPMTDAQWGLPVPPPWHKGKPSWNAAVVCAATGACDHLDCQRGPFSVVFVGSNLEQICLHVYSSEAGGAWSNPSYVAHTRKYAIDNMPASLAGNSLYFLVKASTSILKYNLATRGTSLIHLPPRFCEFNIALTAMEDGGLGIARVEGYKLVISSMEASPEGNVEWTDTGVVELKKLLPDDAFSTPVNFIFSAHGVGVFFVGTDNGLFTIDVVNPGRRTPGLIPFNRFYMPAVTD